MELFKTLGKWLMLGGAGILLWDVVMQFVSKNIFKVRSVKEWGTDISLTYYIKLENYLHTVLSPSTFTKFVNLPFGAVLFGTGFALYIFYRILFIAFGGKGGGGNSGYVYKSRH